LCGSVDCMAAYVTCGIDFYPQLISGMQAGTDTRASSSPSISFIIQYLPR
jgi:hypothetical protein